MKVSFIIPVYNVQQYLPRCLDSILGQTVEDWEAVCVNDGSTDGSGSILREWAARDSRIVVVDKPNGGLSDARNAGVAIARGEYIVFVDSDDYIHPQTLEIALSVQRRSNADMVSWYKDTKYRNTQIVRDILHLDSVNFKPAAYRTRYDADAVEYDLTDDVFSVATEITHQKDILRPIKHCYVWRHLIRREILEGIDFVKGIAFEDFPWWSSVMLKSPKIAYTSLPLYFYCYNKGSIDVGSTRGRKVDAWIKGLLISVNEYSEKATAYQMDCWSRNFKWPVIRKHIARFLPAIKRDNPYFDSIADGLKRLQDTGAFVSAAGSCDKKAAAQIETFLEGYFSKSQLSGSR